MTNYDLFSYHPTGTQLRDKALERVADNAGEDFMTRAMNAIRAMPSRQLVIGEDIRRHLTELGIEPHHSNAWGAVMVHAVRLKLLTPTGAWRAMKQPSSHARKTPEYYIR